MNSIFKYNLTEIEKKQISDFLLSFNFFSVLQCPQWNDIINSHKKICYFLKFKNNEIIAYALIIENYLEIYIPFGPLSHKEEQISQSIIEIRNHYKLKRKASFVVQLGVECGASAELIEKNVLQEIKYNQKADVTNWSTLILKLSGDIDSLFKNFSQNHKRSIKKAKNFGLKVRRITSLEDISKLADIYDEMYKKRKILKPFANTHEVFKNIFNVFFKENKGFFLGVFNSESILIGGACFTVQNRTLMYQYGCTLDNNKLPVLHIAFYEAICLAMELNLMFFDFCGYNVYVSEKDQVFQINRFKKGFGGELVHYPSRLKFTLSPIKLFLFNIFKYVYFYIRKL